MRKWTNRAKLFLAFGLISAASSCHYLPKSECGLTETDGKNILGINVVAIDKNDSVFGIPESDKSSKACGYIPQNSNEKGNLFTVTLRQAPSDMKSLTDLMIRADNTTLKET